MSNISNLLKENYDLKNELESMVMRVKENEAKHNGFKVIQFSMLLSDNLDEISNKPIKYIEEIFDIERAVLFIRKDSLAVAQNYESVGSRVRIISHEAFTYTFLDDEVRSGTDKAVIHKEFQLMPQDIEYSYVLVPITDNGRMVAALGFYSSDKNRFTKEYNFDFVEEFALIASIALRKLDNAFLLEMQANTDYLTGLPNKFIFDLTGNNSFKEYKENGRSFTFIMFDLNNYKYINDELGHLAGDEILKIIARNMRECIGDYDILGRFGGDEFYLFTETIDKDKLNDLAKRLIKSVEETEYNDNINVKNGFCAGVVIVKAGNFNSFEDIVRLADSRLYGAKGKIKRENGLAVESMVMGIDDDN